MAQQPRPYMNPYLAGALLGVVLFLVFFVTGGGLGASSALTHVQTGDPRCRGPGARQPYRLLCGDRRRPPEPLRVQRRVHVPRHVLGGAVSGLLHRRTKLETRKGPGISFKTRWAFALGGGLIMAYGARLARGCTSGQALSGGAVLSVGSWAFMFSIFAGGYAGRLVRRRFWIWSTSTHGTL